MDQDNDRSKSFTRRAFIIGAGQGLILGILGARLAWLQVAQGARYKTLAEENRINVKMVAPLRGEIVDRFGVPFAVNNENYRVLVVPEQTDDLEGALIRLSKIIDLEKENIEQILKIAKKSAAFLPLEVRDSLSWEEVSKIEVNITDLPGIGTDVGKIRHYPFKEATAHIVGYVAAPSEADVGEDPVLTLPGFRIGKTGVEKVYDRKLRGNAGRAEMEVNVVGREVRTLKQEQSTSGKRITLTIDAELQLFTQQRLSLTKSASAVIMDVKDGAIYALNSFPSFDPNLFTRGVGAQQWEELLNNPAFPLTNKSIAGQYPPGSTFKMVTALAALKENLISAHTSFDCPGHYDYGKDRFHCWKRGGHGSVNLVKAMSESCDTYFYKIATDLGVDKIAKMAKELGLGERLEFELSEEKPGLMPDKDWKRGRFGQSWQPGETIVTSIGQGYILTTPLQLATMTCRLVNGGYAVKPWITAYEGTHQKEHVKWPKIGLSATHLNLVKRGMDQAVNHKKGTAFGSRIEDKDFAMGGKTGTAQVKRITRQERAMGIKNEDLPWHFRHHALFVGYAPVHDPRYVCAVIVEHGGGGSSAAAPIAKDLLLQTQERNPGAAPIKEPGPDADGQLILPVNHAYLSEQ